MSQFLIILLMSLAFIIFHGIMYVRNYCKEEEERFLSSDNYKEIEEERKLSEEEAKRNIKKILEETEEELNFYREDLRKWNRERK